MSKKYFGGQTEKALRNFPFSINAVSRPIVVALVMIKKAAASANAGIKVLDKSIANAIGKACDEILAGKFSDQFPVRALQGGAGTSIHMNVNEVIASRATEILHKRGKGGGKGTTVHPNDHVNRGQSTNDVTPSAIKVAALPLMQDFAEELRALAADLEKKSKEFKRVIKLGRTHLQDAVPTMLGAEFGSYAAVIRRHEKNIERAYEHARTLNLGGTAVGNGANTGPGYLPHVYKALNKITEQKFRPAKNLMSHTSSHTDILAISQTVVAALLDASKIASDLRLLSSGPGGGLGEITLAELQKGSSIMPGKVNPVMPEMVSQLYFMASGNNLTIEEAVHAAQLELGVMLPIVADRLVQSLVLGREGLHQFRTLCVRSIKADPGRCLEHLERSTAYATLFTPALGYEPVSEIVKESVATGRKFKDLVLQKKLLNEREFDRVVKDFSERLVG